MTDDLIGRQAALEKIRTMQTYKLFAGDDMILIDQAEAQTELMMLPSAQPEIIYCKDCKWCVEHYDTDGNVPYWICKNWDAGTDAEGFCHEAERREDATD